MALFLSESLRSRVPNIPLDEALAGLIEVMHEGQSLTEALYKADFVMYLQEKVEKTEMDVGHSDFGTGKTKKFKSNEDMGFMERAWEAIKAFGRKLWQKLKLVFNAIKNKLTVWFQRIMGNKNEIFTVKVRDLESIKIQLLFSENMILISQRVWKSSDDLDEAIEKNSEDTQNKMEKAEDIDEDKLVKISKSELKQLASRAQAVSEKGEKSEKLNKDEEAKIDSEFKKMKADKNVAQAFKDEASDLMKVYKAKNRAIAALAGKNTAIANKLASMVAAGAAAENDVDGDYETKNAVARRMALAKPN